MSKLFLIGGFAMRDNSIVNDIIEEIGNCEDPSQLKALTDKLKDAMAMQGGDLMRKIVEKWANKLKPFKSDNDIKNLAAILENQYCYLKNNDVGDYENEERKKIDLLKEQAKEIGGEAGEILRKTANEKESKLPPKWDETFPMRGVNLQDEVVKLYDCISMKPMIGIQPMQGPVGMAYAIRFRKPTPKKDITKQEILKNYQKETDKNYYVNTFEDIPEHYLEIIRLTHNIEGELVTENEVALTVENKELASRTRKLKLKGMQKVSGPEIAKEIDFELANRVIGMALPVGFVSTEMLLEQLTASKMDVANTTKRGVANCILSNGKYINEEITKLFEHNIVFPQLQDHTIVIGFSGDKDNDRGLIYCPYIPILFAKAIGVEAYSPNAGVMTRYGIMDSLPGSENYYHKLHVIDAKEEVIENFRRFYNNTMQGVDNNDNKKIITCIAMRVYQELSDNFQKVIPVAETISDDMDIIPLKARWSVEAQQDLKAMTNIDLEEEMMELMAYEIINEIKELDFAELHSFGFLKNEYGTMTPRQGVYVKVLNKSEPKSETIIRKYVKFLNGMTSDQHVKQCAYFLKNTEERNKNCDDSMLTMASNIYKQIINSAGNFVGIQVPTHTDDTATSYRLRFRQGDTKEEVGLQVEQEKIPMEILTKSISYDNKQVNQELASMHGIDVGEEIRYLASYEFASQVSLFITNHCKEVSQNAYSWKYPTDRPKEFEANGNFLHEVFKTLYTTILNASENIAKETRRGAGNTVLVSPKCAVALQSLGEFIQTPRDHSTHLVSLNHIGEMNGIQVYRNCYQATDDILVTFKGSSESDAGIICVLESLEFIDGKEIKLRYALDKNAEGYYKNITVDLNIK
jgi:hypothetical protein